MSGHRATGALRSHKQGDVAAVALLNEPTRRKLYEAVVEAGGLGRDAAAARTGISRHLAAFHLDRLVEGGLLKVTHRRLSGRTGPGAGRPAKVYARADKDISVSLPSRSYDLLAQTLVEGAEALAQEVGEEKVAGALDEQARQHGRAAGKTVRASAGPRAGREKRAGALLNLLEESGFEPSIGADQITLRNCPYQAIAQDHRNLTCGMNLAWAEGVLEEAGATGFAPKLDIEPGRCCVVFTTK